MEQNKYHLILFRSTLSLLSKPRFKINYRLTVIVQNVIATMMYEYSMIHYVFVCYFSEEEYICLMNSNTLFSRHVHNRYQTSGTFYIRMSKIDSSTVVIPSVLQYSSHGEC